MRFQVLVDAEPRPVELIFGGENELATISRWRAPLAVASRPAVRDHFLIQNKSLAFCRRQFREETFGDA